MRSIIFSLFFSLFFSFTIAAEQNSMCSGSQAKMDLGAICPLFEEVAHCSELKEEQRKLCPPVAESLGKVTLLSGQSCVSSIWDDIRETIWSFKDILVGLFKNVFDKDTRNTTIKQSSAFFHSISNFFEMEFVKAKREVGPPKNVRALIKVTKNLINFLMEKVSSFLARKLPSVNCMKHEVKVATTCRFLSAMLIPPGNAKALIKHGPDALAKSPGIIKTLEKTGLKSSSIRKGFSSLNKRDPSEKIRSYLGQYAFYAAEERNKLPPQIKKFFMQMKNDPEFSDWVAKRVSKGDIDDLFSSEGTEHLLKKYPGKKDIKAEVIEIDLEDKSLNIIKKDEKTLFEYRDVDLGEITEYEQAMLSIRKGDLVSATSKVNDQKTAVELGNFLGTGNTTQVFEVANDTNKVVRLPFYSKSTRSAERLKNSGERGKFNKVFVEEMDKYRGIDGLTIPRIYDHGKNYEYVVTDKFSNFTPGDELIGRYVDLVERGSLNAKEKIEVEHIEGLLGKMENTAKEIAKRSGKERRVKAIMKDDNVDAIWDEMRQVGFTPSGEMILLDIE